MVFLNDRIRSFFFCCVCVCILDILETKFIMVPFLHTKSWYFLIEQKEKQFMIQLIIQEYGKMKDAKRTQYYGNKYRGGT